MNALSDVMFAVLATIGGIAIGAGLAFTIGFSIEWFHDWRDRRRFNRWLKAEQAEGRWL